MEAFHMDLPSILKGSLYHQLCVLPKDVDVTKLTGFVSLFSSLSHASSPLKSSFCMAWFYQGAGDVFTNH